MLTFIQSLVIAFSAHFVGIVALYAYLLLAGESLLGTNTTQGVYHLASIYTSITGMSMAGFFSNMGKREVFSAVVFIVVLHFVSGFILGQINEQALLTLVREQATSFINRTR